MGSSGAPPPPTRLMPDKKKKLTLAGGKFSRDSVEDDAEVVTVEQYIERAAACLEEAARSQSPNNESYTRQAEVWFQLAKFKSAAD